MVWLMEQEFSKNTFVLQENEEIGSVKIADDVVECEKSRIFKQVQNGVYARMAMINLALDK